MPDIAFAYAVLAGILDVGANLASTKSNGFSKKGWGVLSILLVLAARSKLHRFSCRRRGTQLRS